MMSPEDTVDKRQLNLFIIVSFVPKLVISRLVSFICYCEICIVNNFKFSLITVLTVETKAHSTQ
jgi:hypothetical protein